MENRGKRKGGKEGGQADKQAGRWQACRKEMMRGQSSLHRKAKNQVILPHRVKPTGIFFQVLANHLLYFDKTFTIPTNNFMLPNQK